MGTEDGMGAEASQVRDRHWIRFEGGGEMCPSEVIVPSGRRGGGGDVSVGGLLSRASGDEGRAHRERKHALAPPGGGEERGGACMAGSVGGEGVSALGALRSTLHPGWVMEDPGWRARARREPRCPSAKWLGITPRANTQPPPPVWTRHHRPASRGGAACLDTSQGCTYSGVGGWCVLG